MTTTTSPYGARIAQATDENPRHVEAYMRLEYGTLDHLDSDRFDRTARECAEAVRLDRGEAEALAVSMGL